MQTARGFNAAMKIGLCIALGGAGLAAAHNMQNAAGNPADFIAGSVSLEEKQAIAAQFVLIQEVSQKPAKLRQFVTKSLELSGCYELTNGGKRCAYWDPLLMNGRAMVLTNMYLDGSRSDADAGGFALWNLRQDVCVSPQLFIQLFNTKPNERPARMGEPIGGVLDEGGMREYVFSKLNERWGNVIVVESLRRDCVVSVEFQLSRQ